MRFRLLTLSLVLLIPSLGFAQRKEYIQLQRDIAILQEDVRALQRSLDEKTQQLNLLGQQALDNVNKANTSIVTLENDLRERLQNQQKSVAGPVANLNTRLDQMTSQLQAVKESVDALNIRFGKLEQQMVDTANAIRTLQAPPAPPSQESGMSAETLYSNALRDKGGGSFDLALKEFQEYLQLYPDTALAPNAQYYIGEIYYLQDKMEDSIKAFDLVLEKYPENEKTPDAHFMKGRALLRIGQRAKARAEFETLIKRFPNNELADRAKQQLKALGVSRRD